MDAAVKQKVMIGIIVVCLVAAIAITVFTRSGDPARGSVQMLCTNPDCGRTFEMSKDDFRKKVREMAMGSGGQMGQMSPMTCPHCGKESAYQR